VFVRIYWVLLQAGCRRQATYRLALLSGLLTHAFFGVVRTAVFLALYRDRGQVGGLAVSDTLTYTWLLEAVFGVVWATWVWEFPESVRSGDFAVELLRPGDPYLRIAAFDLGRALYLLVTRAIPVVAVAAVVLPLHLPTSPGGILALAASVMLAAAIAFQIRFLFGMASFWTPDYRAVYALLSPLLYLSSGFVIPIDYFPAALRGPAQATPLYSLVMAPVRVAIGRSAGAALAGQALWLLVLATATRSLLALASRRLVVHGG
jgi:ABC-2 type transport system permease protein